MEEVDIRFLGGMTLAFAVDLGSRVVYGKYFAPNMKLSDAQKAEVKVVVDSSAELINQLRKNEMGLEKDLAKKTIELSTLQQQLQALESQSAELRAQSAKTEQELRERCSALDKELRDKSRSILIETLQSGISLYKVRKAIYKTVLQKLTNKTALDEVDLALKPVNDRMAAFEAAKMIDLSDTVVAPLFSAFITMRQEAAKK